MISSNAAVFACLCSLCIGLAALWPIRRFIGNQGLWVAAFPVGVLGWSLVAVASTVLDAPFGLVSVVMGSVLLIGGCWALSSLVSEMDFRASLSEIIGHLKFVAVFGVTAAVLSIARLTVATPDSWGDYWPMAVRLAREGSISVNMLANRGVSSVSIGAAAKMFGSGWAYVIYPMMALAVIATMYMLMRSGPLSAVNRRTRALSVMALFVFFLATPTFIYQSFYVHSHMISAMFLLLSLAALWFASAGRLDDSPLIRPWLMVSGLSAAGLALARPDGLAYVFVPIVIAVSVVTSRAVAWRDVLAFFAPLLAVVGSVYATGFLTLGLWEARKLDGVTALAILALMAGSAALPLLVARMKTVFRLPVMGVDFARAVAVAGAMALMIVLVAKPETVWIAAANAAVNLFGGAGAWGHVWWSFAALLGLSVFSGDALRRGSWTSLVFSAVVLFLVIAGLVHGTSHAGRIGSGDSFNRVAFHITPVILWYLSMVLGRIAVEREQKGRTSATIQPAEVG